MNATQAVGESLMHDSKPSAVQEPPDVQSAIAAKAAFKAARRDFAKGASAKYGGAGRGLLLLGDWALLSGVAPALRVVDDLLVEAKPLFGAIGAALDVYATSLLEPKPSTYGSAEGLPRVCSCVCSMLTRLRTHAAVHGRSSSPPPRRSRPRRRSSGCSRRRAAPSTRSRPSRRRKWSRARPMTRRPSRSSSSRRR